MAVAVGFVAWLVLRDDDGSSNARTQGAATAIKRAYIATLARSVGHPIYWLRPKRDTTYEVTQAANGKIYVRYLPSGVTSALPSRTSPSRRIPSPAPTRPSVGARSRTVLPSRFRGEHDRR